LSAVKKRAISKLAADIARIEKSFFPTEDPDLDQSYHGFKRKRQHLLRSIVLELHLSIEEIITVAPRPTNSFSNRPNHKRPLAG
jgi:hypothetical protein